MAEINLASMANDYSDDWLRQTTQSQLDAGMSHADIVAGMKGRGVGADQYISAFQTGNPELYAQPADFAGQIGSTDTRWTNLSNMGDSIRALYAGPTPAGTPTATPTPTPRPTPAPTPAPSAPFATTAPPSWRPTVASDLPGSSGAPQMAVGPQQAATQWKVDPNHTVAKQLEEIIRGDGPLMQQARTRALQQMAARGGVNTTMAAQAGESALYDAAFPIASQDSDTYNEAGRFNADSLNQFARDANAFEREKEQANFNVTANDWANAQEFGRTLIRDDKNNAFMLSRDGSLHAYDMERDAANNEFTLGRDESQNALLLERDRLNNQFTTQRDTAQNAFTLARDESQNDFTTERDTANNNFTLARDDRQIAATTSRDATQTAAAERSAATTAINNAKTNYASQLAAISSNSNMSAELKTEALGNLQVTFNTIIRENARLLGWDAESWLIAEDAPEDKLATETVPGQGGGSGAGLLSSTPQNV